MPESIIEAFGGKVAEQWTDKLLTPAFAFWAGGLAAWCLQEVHRQYIAKRIEQAPAAELVVLAVAALFVVAVTDALSRQLQVAMITLLAGYLWPARFKTLFLRRLDLRYQSHLESFQKLFDKTAGGAATVSETAQLAAIRAALSEIPIRAADRLPTALGNILRSAETLPFLRYGLDTSICWPRLWLLLPDGAKKDVSEARSNLNAGARLCLWSVLFLIWSALTWWAIPVSFLGACVSYWWMKRAARGYSTLIRAAFDVYRPELYKALRRDMAKDASEEVNLGLAISKYLWEGSDSPQFLFTAFPAGSGP